MLMVLNCPGRDLRPLLHYLRAVSRWVAAVVREANLIRGQHPRSEEHRALAETPSQKGWSPGARKSDQFVVRTWSQIVQRHALKMDALNPTYPIAIPPKGIGETLV